MKRQGQMQLSETIAILFIFFVLILFGIIFYYKYSQVALKQENEELLQKRAVATTLKALFLPELICSDGDTEPEDNCVDMLKARHARQTFEAHESIYFQLFSFSRISVHQIYPPVLPENSELLIWDKPKDEFTKLESTFFVVALRDETLAQDRNPENFAFGYLQVGVYS
jgi:hypothetical protein